jgi:hypothetical protein
MTGLFAIFVMFVAVCVAGGQEGATLSKRFTNQDVIEMAKLGLSDEVIITKIRQAYQAGTEAVHPRSRLPVIWLTAGQFVVS